MTLLGNSKIKLGNIPSEPKFTLGFAISQQSHLSRPGCPTILSPSIIGPLQGARGVVMSDFIKVAEVGDLEEGDLMFLEVDGEPICLAKANEVICAFTDTCTHIGGSLSE